MKNEYASEANKRIASARKKSGFTQQQAADALNMKRNTYARMERLGNPSIDELKSLTKLYQVSADWLLYGSSSDDDNSQFFNLLNNDDFTPLKAAQPINPFEEYLPFTPSSEELNFIRVLHILRKKESRDAAFKYLNNLYHKEIDEKKEKQKK